MDDGFAGARELAVAAALGGDIDNHRTGRHASAISVGDQDGRFAAGHGGGGDDDVLFFDDEAQLFALAP